MFRPAGGGSEPRSRAAPLMAVTVDTSAGFEFGAPVRLLEDGFRIYQQPPSYDVSPDGRFVTLRSEAVPTISVLLNWPGLFRAAGGGD